jgi:hypothetical protein
VLVLEATVGTERGGSHPAPPQPRGTFRRGLGQREQRLDNQVRHASPHRAPVRVAQGALPSLGVSPCVLSVREADSRERNPDGPQPPLRTRGRAVSARPVVTRATTAARVVRPVA